MSPTPSSSTDTSKSTDNSSTIAHDSRLQIAIIILSIVAVVLVGWIVFITLRVKRRQLAGEDTGPFQGTVMNDEHPAAQIIPFGGGLQAGAQGPRFNHNPGEDMRIAIRRPDGAWHFADSRTPFTPTGVSELDVLPSPMSSTASLLSFSSTTKPLSRKAQEAKLDRSYRRRYDPDFDDSEPNPLVPPPPAYYPETPRDPFAAHPN